MLWYKQFIWMYTKTTFVGKKRKETIEWQIVWWPSNISYVRANLNPVLSEEAEEIIINYFQKLSKEVKLSERSDWGIHILETLTRLSLAWARTELRDKVSRGDLENVIEIFEHSTLKILKKEYSLMRLCWLHLFQKIASQFNKTI